MMLHNYVKSLLDIRYEDVSIFDINTKLSLDGLMNLN